MKPLAPIVSPARIAWGILPTFCIIYAFSYSPASALRAHREGFRSAQGLELSIASLQHPQAWFNDASSPIRFTGRFYYDDWEEWISGYRWKQDGKWFYRFQYSEGEFRGEVMAGESECRPDLEFQVLRDAAAIRSGTLRGDFCL